MFIFVGPAVSLLLAPTLNTFYRSHFKNSINFHCPFGVTRATFWHWGYVWVVIPHLYQHKHKHIVFVLMTEKFLIDTLSDDACELATHPNQEEWEEGKNYQTQWKYFGRWPNIELTLLARHQVGQSSSLSFHRQTLWSCALRTKKLLQSNWFLISMFD